MNETIIAVAVGMIIMLLLELAYCEAKRRAKAARRKLRRKVGTQSHKVFHRA